MTEPQLRRLWNWVREEQDCVPNELHGPYPYKHDKDARLDMFNVCREIMELAVDISPSERGMLHQHPNLHPFPAISGQVYVGEMEWT